jgi:hypothetical protein
MQRQMIRDLDQIKEDRMSEACSTRGRDEKGVQYFGCKTRREEKSWKT